MGYINTEVKMPSIGDAIKQEDITALAEQLGHNIYPIKNITLGIVNGSSRTVEPNDFNVFCPDSTLYLRDDKFLGLYICDYEFLEAGFYSDQFLDITIEYDGGAPVPPIRGEYSIWPIYNDYIDMQKRALAIYIKVPDEIGSQYVELYLTTGNYEFEE